MNNPAKYSWFLTCALAVSCAPPDINTETEVRAHRQRDVFHEILTIEDHRLYGSAELAAFFEHHNPAVRAAAVGAAGRIGDPGLIPLVIDALDDRSDRVREAAAFALAILRGEDARVAVEARLAVERDASVKEKLVFALGRVGNTDALPVLSALIERPNSTSMQRAGAEALRALFRRLGAAVPPTPATMARLTELANRAPNHRAMAAIYTLTSASTALAPLDGPSLISGFERASDPTTRGIFLRVLQRVNTPAAVEVIAQAALEDDEIIVRAEAVKALGGVTASATVIDTLVAALDDPIGQVAVAAVQSLGRQGVAASGTAPILAAHFDDPNASVWIRTEILPVLVAFDPVLARPRVDAALNGTDVRPRVMAISLLAQYGSDADLAILEALVDDPLPIVRSFAIDTFLFFPADRLSPELRAKILARLPTDDLLELLEIATVALQFNWTEFAPALAATYDHFPGQAGMFAREAIVYALGRIGTVAELPIIELALDDPERVVVVSAAESYQLLTGIDVSDRIPVVSRVLTETPSAHEIRRAVRATVELETTRGTIVMRMREETPLSSTNFVRLVESGFYDGIDFHRIVPSFVAQGGDPNGDGFGGSADLVREEVTPFEHFRGAVGMATAGKDTGSSQIFIDHIWNQHLDGVYTTFAEVVRGMNVVDRLEVGDTILHARVRGCGND